MAPVPVALGDYCAIDFGTANSAVAIPSASGMQLVTLEPDFGERGRTMPTAVFYLAEGPDLQNFRDSMDALPPGLALKGQRAA